MILPLQSQLIGLTCRLLGRLLRQKAVPAQPARILVLKPCCLGDVVLATPALLALNQAFPQAKIDVAVGSWSQAVLQNSPYIHQLIDSGKVGQGTYTWRDVLALAQTLRSESYDLALILDRSPLVGLVPLLAQIPHRVGLDSFGRGFAHTQRVPVPPHARHEAKLYLDVVARLGVTVYQQNQPLFWSNFHPPAEVEHHLPDIPQPFAILHPGGGQNPGMAMLNKRWPLDRLAKLGDVLAERGLTPVLSGAPAEVEVCQQVAQQMKHPPYIVAGQLSLAEFGALCQKSQLFVGGDTGAMHIAVAMGSQVLAIFGPSDPKHYGPFAPPSQSITLWRAFNLPAGGVGQGQVDFSWEHGVDVAEAIAACEQLLKQNG